MTEGKVWADGSIDTGSNDEVSGARLRSFIERIERMNEEVKALKEDTKEIYAEAKGNGFDPKIIRAIIRLRGIDPDKRAEEETLLDLYMAALGAM